MSKWAELEQARWCSSDPSEYWELRAKYWEGEARMLQEKIDRLNKIFREIPELQEKIALGVKELSK